MSHGFLLSILLGLSISFSSSSTWACGGFFCQVVPINQAAEQIVFRQEGNDVTAMVRILYQGEAEDFSWVVPVPTTPELSVGSDLTFTQLDLATRPQFNLEQRGESCEPTSVPVASPIFPIADGDGTPESVTVEEQTVGPFDVQTVSSDNPDALANWLTENDYDIGTRGAELIAPYVEQGMKFVALKLRSGESSGSIRPLIMKYQSASPMIPIKLTAIAAQEDMGVLVWVVGNARAVPDNYLHVTPNYTRLNWYTGTLNAYASYQTLITAAMDEAGGQGFATDMAGLISDEISSSLTQGEQLDSQLAGLDGLTRDAEFLSGLYTNALTQTFLNEFQNTLPPPPGQDNSIYFEPLALEVNYTNLELASARTELRQKFIEIEIDPIKAGTSLLPVGAYMTRLYTTLSADEMTVDPVFVYNTAMPDQSTTRNAVLEASCTDSGTEWTLTLGAGTGRDDEIVISANTEVPFGAAPVVLNDQPSIQLIEDTAAADAIPQITSQPDFDTIRINSDGELDNPVVAANDDDDGFLGLGSLSLNTLAIIGIFMGGSWLRRRRQSRHT